MSEDTQEGQEFQVEPPKEARQKELCNSPALEFHWALKTAHTQLERIQDGKYKGELEQSVIVAPTEAAVSGESWDNGQPWVRPGLISYIFF